MNPSIQSHADRLAAASAVTAAARQHVDDAAALAADVADLKLRAAGGDLDDAGAADLVAKAERVRINDITAPRRKRALDDATEAEVRVSLDVLAELARTVDGLAKEAATAADALSGVLVDIAAQSLRSDTASGYERDRGRCMVEQFFPGIYGAAVLADRIKTASTTTWGSSHIPSAAREIVQSFDSDVKSVRDGIDGLRAVHKVAVKTFR